MKLRPSIARGPIEPVKCGMQTATLTCHPATPCEAVRRSVAHMKVSPTGTLTLEYSLKGDIGHLRIPAAGEPRRAEKLWQHTCFEAFIATPDDAGYYELNFSPSGEWAVYGFDGYREGMTAGEAVQPPIATHRDPQRFVLEAAVALDEFADFRNRAKLRLALSAVIEESNGRLSYWALAHPSSKPDFHHADSFVLTLDRSGRLA